MKFWRGRKYLGQKVIDHHSYGRENKYLILCEKLRRNKIVEDIAILGRIKRMHLLQPKGGDIVLIYEFIFKYGSYPEIFLAGLTSVSPTNSNCGMKKTQYRVHTHEKSFEVLILIFKYRKFKVNKKEWEGKELVVTNLDKRGGGVCDLRWAPCRPFPSVLRVSFAFHSKPNKYWH